MDLKTIEIIDMFRYFRHFFKNLVGQHISKIKMLKQ